MTIAASHHKPSGPGLGTIRAAVARGPLLTAAAVLAAAGAAAAVWATLPVPKLTAYVQFRIHAVTPYFLSPIDREDFTLYRANQAQILKSRMVLNSALRNPAVADAVAALPEADKVTALDGMLKVNFPHGPEFMRLYAEGDDAERLMAVVTGVARAYLDDVVNRKKTNDRARREKLQQYETDWATKVELTSKLLAGRMEAQHAAGNTDARAYDRDRKGDLMREKLQVDKQMLLLQVQQQMLADPGQAKGAAGDVAVQQRLLADPAYRAMADHRDRLRLDLEANQNLLAPGRTNPLLDAKAKELADLDDKWKKAEARIRPEVEAAVGRAAEQEVSKAQQQVASDMKYRQALRDAIERELQELSAERLKATTDLYDLDGLRSRLARERANLENVQGQLNQMQLEADAPDRVVKWEEDVVPGVEGNRRLKYSAMAGLGVLFVGLAGLVARELRSPRVADARQLTGDLGVPLVGMLPMFDDHGGPAAVARAAVDGSLVQNLNALEAVNSACTVLHHGSGDGPPAKVILVTSAVSGEGKTALSMLLASSMAQAGYRTLLIDGDLRRPSLHAQFGLAPRPGLCDYLAGGGGELVQATDVPGLAVMAAGRWSRAASYALASGKRWRALLTEAAAQFEYIIIDSSPLLPVADGLLMARHVDGVVLSAMRGLSELEPLREAVRQVRSVDTRLLGVVLNGVSPRTYYRYPYLSQPADEVVPLLGAPPAPELAARSAD